jgi:hypothetical protein
MKRLLLIAALTLPGLAFANASHHSSGGSSSSSHSSSSDVDPEGACLVWSSNDAGVDAGAAEDAEAADAGHPGEICTEHAKSFGCSIAGFGGPAVLLAIGLMKRRKSK